MPPRLVPFALLLAPSVAVADEPPAPTLPAEAVWVLRYDGKVDGELKPKPGSEVRWRVSSRNGRVSGSLAGKKEGDPSDHKLSGEVAEGKPPVVSLRQDGPKGLVCYYAGTLSAGKVVGTWYDNRGGSGDFEMAAEK
jgi:hypothetical protein